VFSSLLGWLNEDILWIEVNHYDGKDGLKKRDVIGLDWIEFDRYQIDGFEFFRLPFHLGHYHRDHEQALHLVSH
jgi:hypothetical protein